MKNPDISVDEDKKYKQRLAARIYREKNREQINQKSREFSHTDKRKKYIKNYKEKNKEKIKQQGRDYRQSHKEKSNESSRNYYNKNKEKELDRIRFKKYGITGDLFREILERQGEKCPICGKVLTKNPSVDHDHITGKIRGLICNSCNLTIGIVGESPEILRNIAKYLEDNL
jgi:hypothetical protein